MNDPHDASTARRLLDWFLSTEDAADMRGELERLPPAVWPAFMAEAAELDKGARPVMKRRRLRVEQQRRELLTNR